MVHKFPVFYRICRSITVLTKAVHSKVVPITARSIALDVNSMPAHGTFSMLTKWTSHTCQVFLLDTAEITSLRNQGRNFTNYARNSWLSLQNISSIFSMVLQVLWVRVGTHWFSICIVTVGIATRLQAWPQSCRILIPGKGRIVSPPPPQKPRPAVGITQPSIRYAPGWIVS